VRVGTLEQLTIHSNASKTHFIPAPNAVIFAFPPDKGLYHSVQIQLSSWSCY